MIIKYIQLYLIILFIVVSFIYMFTRSMKLPPLVPGDFLIQKEGRRVYLPIGSSLIITTVFFLILMKFIH